MFGKKKTKVTETVEAICKVCRANCMDEEGLIRHMAWAHKGAESSGSEKPAETKK